MPVSQLTTGYNPPAKNFSLPSRTTLAIYVYTSYRPILYPVGDAMIIEWFRSCSLALSV